MEQIPRKIVINGTEILNLDATSAQATDVANGRNYYNINGVLTEGTDEINSNEIGTLNATENKAYSAEGSEYAAWNYVTVNVQPNLEEKSCTPSSEPQRIEPSYGKDGLRAVNVAAVQTQAKTAEENGEIVPDAGKFLSSVTVNVQPKLQEKTATKNGDIFPDTDFQGLSKVTVAVSRAGTINLQTKEVTPSKIQQPITADEDYDGLQTVVVKPIPPQYIVPTGRYSILANGEHNVAQYEFVDVMVEGGYGSKQKLVFEGKSIFVENIEVIHQTEDTLTFRG